MVKKDRYIAIIISVLVFLFAGCSNAKVDTGLGQPTSHTNSNLIQLDYFSAGRFSSTVVEIGNFIYYCKSDGIYRIDKTQKTDQQIYAISFPERMIYYEDGIYFTTIDRRDLYYINLNGGDFSIIIDGGDYGYIQDVRVLTDFQIVDHVIYVANAAFGFSYDMETKQIREIVGNVGVDAYQFLNGYFYYISHADKSFTLYKKDLQTSKLSPVLGTAKIYPDTDIIKDFLWINKILYFVKEDGLFRVEDGQMVEISDANVSGIFEYQDQFYYIAYDETDTSQLKKYNEQNGSSSVIAELNKYEPSAGATILEDRVIYNNQAERKPSYALIR